MKVKVNGVELNCRIDGKEGAPWITFSHALCNNLSLWDEQVALLAGRYRILRYDQRGHGASPPVKGPFTFAMLIADVVALWDHLGIDRSHWCGLSIGGMIGYGLAQDHGHRMLSLIACDARPDAPPDYQAYFQHRIDAAREAGMEALVALSIDRWFTPETRAKNPPALEKVRQMIRTTSPEGHEGCCEALKTLAFGARLGEIRVPTLIVGGAADKGAPADVLGAAAAAIRGAKHAVLPACGHIANIENPPAFNAALESFLAAV